MTTLWAIRTPAPNGFQGIMASSQKSLGVPGDPTSPGMPQNVSKTVSNSVDLRQRTVCYDNAIKWLIFMSIYTLST